MTTEERPVRPKTSRRAWRPFRSLVRLGGFSFVLLFGGLLVLYAFQTRMIFPGSSTQGTPEAILSPDGGIDLIHLKTARGVPVVAAFGAALTERGEPRADAANRPTMLYFYGNGWCMRWAADGDMEHFRRLGVNVLIPDYVGFGMSGGAPSESGCYETADACLDHLQQREDVDPALIVAVGRSLGGAVAIDLAARRKVAGLVAFCTFTRMVAMARKRFPLLPASLLLKHRFESLDKIARVTCPILLGHGSRDQVVPAEMTTALAIAAAKGTRVTTFTVEGADHNDFYDVGEHQILDSLGAFLKGIFEGKPVLEARRSAG